MDLKRSIRRLEKGETLKLVALGDSLTYGWMVERGYLDFLKEMFVVHYPRGILKIVNRGIPGDTAEGGLARLQQHVIASAPDLVFVQFGLNDAFCGCSIDAFARNIIGIIKGIQKGSGADILLMTSGALEDREFEIAGPFYDRLAAIAEQQSVPIALVHRHWEQKVSEGVSFDTLVQADRVHPTTEGYRLMAEAVVECFNV